MKYPKKDIEESRATLLEWLKPGMTVYTALDHVSRSGMSRNIRLILIEDDGPRYLTYHAARVLGYPMVHDAIKIGGCGMDMGFALVYQLGMKLWPEGTPEPHGRRNGEPDSNGGYALRQRWI